MWVSFPWERNSALVQRPGSGTVWRSWAANSWNDNMMPEGKNFTSSQGKTKHHFGSTKPKLKSLSIHTSQQIQNYDSLMTSSRFIHQKERTKKVSGFSKTKGLLEWLAMYRRSFFLNFWPWTAIICMPLRNTAMEQKKNEHQSAFSKMTSTKILEKELINLLINLINLISPQN